MAAESTELEALETLVASDGWRHYRDLVLDEIGRDFEEHITKALNIADEAMAIDKMRQIAAVRKAGLRWLKLPQERVRTLSQEARDRSMPQNPSRRGDL